MRPEHNTYKRARYHARRREWIEENGPCARCGSIERLEVDHIDPNLKTSHSLPWTCSLERMNKELENCQVLCHECHLVKTREDYEARRVIRHGTRTAYQYYRCRCDLCRRAQALYRKSRVLAGAST
jgi:5-methylcytosine-specific restriction endonuclease McrA